MTAAASIGCQTLVLDVEGVWIAEPSDLEAGGVRRFSKVDNVNNRVKRLSRVSGGGDVRVSGGGDVRGVKDNKVWPAM